MFQGTAEQNLIKKRKGKSMITQNLFGGRINKKIDPCIVTAKTDWELLCIEKEDYDTIISTSNEFQMFKNREYLRKLPFLQDWSLSKREEFWDALVSL